MQKVKSQHNREHGQGREKYNTCYVPSEPAWSFLSAAVVLGYAAVVLGYELTSLIILSLLFLLM